MMASGCGGDAERWGAPPGLLRGRGDPSDGTIGGEDDDAGGDCDRSAHDQGRRSGDDGWIPREAAEDVDDGGKDNVGNDHSDARRHSEYEAVLSLVAMSRAGAGCRGQTGGLPPENNDDDAVVNDANEKGGFGYYEAQTDICAAVDDVRDSVASFFGASLPDPATLQAFTDGIKKGLADSSDPSIAQQTDLFVSPRKRSALDSLRLLSQSEPYASSPYFRRVFERGISNVEGRVGELGSVGEALRECFDVNGDTARVMAAEADAMGRGCIGNSAGGAAEVEAAERETFHETRGEVEGEGIECDLHPEGLLSRRDKVAVTDINVSGRVGREAQTNIGMAVEDIPNSSNPTILQAISNDTKTGADGAYEPSVTQELSAAGVFGSTPGGTGTLPAGVPTEIQTYGTLGANIDASGLTAEQKRGVEYVLQTVALLSRNDKVASFETNEKEGLAYEAQPSIAAPPGDVRNFASPPVVASLPNTIMLQAISEEITGESAGSLDHSITPFALGRVTPRKKSPLKKRIVRQRSLDFWREIGPPANRVPPVAEGPTTLSTGDFTKVRTANTPDTNIDAASLTAAQKAGVEGALRTKGLLSQEDTVAAIDINEKGEANRKAEGGRELNDDNESPMPLARSVVGFGNNGDQANWGGSENLEAEGKRQECANNNGTPTPSGKMAAEYEKLDELAGMSSFKTGNLGIIDRGEGPMLDEPRGNVADNEPPASSANTNQASLPSPLPSHPQVGEMDMAIDTTLENTSETSASPIGTSLSNPSPPETLSDSVKAEPAGPSDPLNAQEPSPATVSGPAPGEKSANALGTAVGLSTSGALDTNLEFLSGLAAAREEEIEEPESMRVELPGSLDALVAREPSTTGVSGSMRRETSASSAGDSTALRTSGTSGTDIDALSLAVARKEGVKYALQMEGVLLHRDKVAMTDTEEKGAVGYYGVQADIGRAEKDIKNTLALSISVPTSNLTTLQAVGNKIEVGSTGSEEPHPAQGLSAAGAPDYTHGEAGTSSANDSTEARTARALVTDIDALSLAVARKERVKYALRTEGFLSRSGKVANTNTNEEGTDIGMISPGAQNSSPLSIGVSPANPMMLQAISYEIGEGSAGSSEPRVAQGLSAGGVSGSTTGETSAMSANNFAEGRTSGTLGTDIDALSLAVARKEMIKYAFQMEGLISQCDKVAVTDTTEKGGFTHHRAQTDIGIAVRGIRNSIVSSRDPSPSNHTTLQADKNEIKGDSVGSSEPHVAQQSSAADASRSALREIVPTSAGDSTEVQIAGIPNPNIGASGLTIQQNGGVKDLLQIEGLPSQSGMVVATDTTEKGKLEHEVDMDVDTTLDFKSDTKAEPESSLCPFVGQEPPPSTLSGPMSGKTSAITLGDAASVSTARALNANLYFFSGITPTQEEEVEESDGLRKELADSSDPFAVSTAAVSGSTPEATNVSSNCDSVEAQTTKAGREEKAEYALQMGGLLSQSDMVAAIDATKEEAEYEVDAKVEANHECMSDGIGVYHSSPAALELLSNNVKAKSVDSWDPPIVQEPALLGLTSGETPGKSADVLTAGVLEENVTLSGVVTVRKGKVEKSGEMREEPAKSLDPPVAPEPFTGHLSGSTSGETSGLTSAPPGATFAEVQTAGDETSITALGRATDVSTSGLLNANQDMSGLATIKREPAKEPLDPRGVPSNGKGERGENSRCDSRDVCYYFDEGTVVNDNAVFGDGECHFGAIVQSALYGNLALQGGSSNDTTNNLGNRSFAAELNDAPTTFSNAPTTSVGISAADGKEQFDAIRVGGKRVGKDDACDVPDVASDRVLDSAEGLGGTSVTNSVRAGNDGADLSAVTTEQVSIPVKMQTAPVESPSTNTSDGENRLDAFRVCGEGTERDDALAAVADPASNSVKEPRWSLGAEPDGVAADRAAPPAEAIENRPIPVATQTVLTKAAVADATDGGNLLSTLCVHNEGIVREDSLAVAVGRTSNFAKASGGASVAYLKDVVDDCLNPTVAAIEVRPALIETQAALSESPLTNTADGGTCINGSFVGGEGIAQGYVRAAVADRASSSEKGPGVHPVEELNGVAVEGVDPSSSASAHGPAPVEALAALVKVSSANAANGGNKLDAFRVGGDEILKRPFKPVITPKPGPGLGKKIMTVRLHRSNLSSDGLRNTMQGAELKASVKTGDGEATRWSKPLVGNVEGAESEPAAAEAGEVTTSKPTLTAENTNEDELASKLAVDVTSKAKTVDGEATRWSKPLVGNVEGADSEPAAAKDGEVTTSKPIMTAENPDENELALKLAVDVPSKAPSSEGAGPSAAKIDDVTESGPSRYGPEGNDWGGVEETDAWSLSSDGPEKEEPRSLLSANVPCDGADWPGVSHPNGGQGASRNDRICGEGRAEGEEVLEGPVKSAGTPESGPGLENYDVGVLSHQPHLAYDDERNALHGPEADRSVATLDVEAKRWSKLTVGNVKGAEAKPATDNDGEVTLKLTRAAENKYGAEPVSKSIVHASLKEPSTEGAGLLAAKLDYFVDSGLLHHGSEGSDRDEVKETGIWSLSRDGLEKEEPLEELSVNVPLDVAGQHCVSCADGGRGSSADETPTMGGWAEPAIKPVEPSLIGMGDAPLTLSSVPKEDEPSSKGAVYESIIEPSAEIDRLVTAKITGEVDAGGQPRRGHEGDDQGGIAGKTAWSSAHDGSEKDERSMSFPANVLGDTVDRLDVSCDDQKRRASRDNALTVKDCHDPLIKSEEETSPAKLDDGPPTCFAAAAPAADSLSCADPERTTQDHAFAAASYRPSESAMEPYKFVVDPDRDPLMFSDNMPVADRAQSGSLDAEAPNLTAAAKKEDDIKEGRPLCHRLPNGEGRGAAEEKATCPPPRADVRRNQLKGEELDGRIEPLDNTGDTLTVPGPNEKAATAVGQDQVEGGPLSLCSTAVSAVKGLCRPPCEQSGEGDAFATMENRSFVSLTERDSNSTSDSNKGPPMFTANMAVPGIAASNSRGEEYPTDAEIWEGGSVPVAAKSENDVAKAGLLQCKSGNRDQGGVKEKAVSSRKLAGIQHDRLEGKEQVGETQKYCHGSNAPGALWHPSPIYTVPNINSAAKERREDARSVDKRREWNDGLAAMERYIKQHGDCDVPGGHPLVAWVTEQRRTCKRWIQNALDPDRKGMSEGDFERHAHILCLERIRFDWGLGEAASGKCLVRDALATESMNMSPSQREELAVSLWFEGRPRRRRKSAVVDSTTSHKHSKAGTESVEEVTNATEIALSPTVSPFRGEESMIRTNLPSITSNEEPACNSIKEKGNVEEKKVEESSSPAPLRDMGGDNDDEVTKVKDVLPALCIDSHDGVSKKQVGRIGRAAWESRERGGIELTDRGSDPAGKQPVHKGGDLDIKRLKTVLLSNSEAKDSPRTLSAGLPSYVSEKAVGHSGGAPIDSELSEGGVIELGDGRPDPSGCGGDLVIKELETVSLSKSEAKDLQPTLSAQSPGDVSEREASHGGGSQGDLELSKRGGIRPMNEGSDCATNGLKMVSSSNFDIKDSPPTPSADWPDGVSGSEVGGSGGGLIDSGLSKGGVIKLGNRGSDRTGPCGIDVDSKGFETMSLSNSKAQESLSTDFPGNGPEREASLGSGGQGYSASEEGGGIGFVDGGSNCAAEEPRNREGDFDKEGLKNVILSNSEVGDQPQARSSDLLGDVFKTEVGHSGSGRVDLESSEGGAMRLCNGGTDQPGRYGDDLYTKGIEMVLLSNSEAKDHSPSLSTDFPGDGLETEASCGGCGQGDAELTKGGGTRFTDGRLNRAGEGPGCGGGDIDIKEFKMGSLLNSDAHDSPADSSADLLGDVSKREVGHHGSGGSDRGDLELSEIEAVGLADGVSDCVAKRSKRDGDSLDIEGVKTVLSSKSEEKNFSLLAPSTDFSGNVSEKEASCGGGSWGNLELSEGGNNRLANAGSDCATERKGRSGGDLVAKALKMVLLSNTETKDLPPALSIDLPGDMSEREVGHAGNGQDCSELSKGGGIRLADRQLDDAARRPGHGEGDLDVKGLKTVPLLNSEGNDSLPAPCSDFPVDIAERGAYHTSSGRGDKESTKGEGTGCANVGPDLADKQPGHGGGGADTTELKTLFSSKPVAKDLPQAPATELLGDVFEREVGSGGDGSGQSDLESRQGIGIVLVERGSDHVAKRSVRSKDDVNIKGSKTVLAPCSEIEDSLLAPSADLPCAVLERATSRSGSGWDDLELKKGGGIGLHDAGSHCTTKRQEHSGGDLDIKRLETGSLSNSKKIKLLSPHFADLPGDVLEGETVCGGSSGGNSELSKVAMGLEVGGSDRATKHLGNGGSNLDTKGLKQVSLSNPSTEVGTVRISTSFHTKKRLRSELEGDSDMTARDLKLASKLNLKGEKAPALSVIHGASSTIPSLGDDCGVHGKEEHRVFIDERPASISWKDKGTHLSTNVATTKRPRLALEDNDIVATRGAKLASVSDSQGEKMSSSLTNSGSSARICSLGDEHGKHGKDMQDDFIDERPDFISWNENSKKRNLGATSWSTTAVQGLDLNVRSEKKLSHSIQVPPSLSPRIILLTDAPVGHGKCWSCLEKAAESFEGSSEPQSGMTARKSDPPVPSTASVPTTASNVDRPSTELTANSRIESHLNSAEADSENGMSKPALPVGEKVYAARWKSQDRSDAPYYYPGVVGKTGRRGANLVYYVNFHDGDEPHEIEWGLVMPREDYLERNLKPSLGIGGEVYAAWQQDSDGLASTPWRPGVIKHVKERDFGGPYGLIRSYDIVFDDGIEDSLQDHFVMDKDDYLLLTSKAWIGVENRLDRHSVEEDEWARKIGWYVATIDGKEHSFSLLSRALRAYDAHTVQQRGSETRQSDLNLPEEWSFSDSFGTCPPVHNGGANHHRNSDRSYLGALRPRRAAICGASRPVTRTKAISGRGVRQKNDQSLNIKPDAHSKDKVIKKTPRGEKVEEKPSNFTINALATRPFKVAQQSQTVSCIHPTVSDRESSYPALPLEGFPNWTVRRIPRSRTSMGSKTSDGYYYSPKMGYRFRSKREINRFLECMKMTNGDEELAIEQFHGMPKRIKKIPSKSLTTRKMAASPTKASILQYKVLEYVPPSRMVEEKKIYNEEDKGKVAKTKLDPNAKAATSKYVKPIIKKGQKVYACWSGPDGKGQVWYPGRVWDVKEHPGGEFGPIKKYDVVFDDGDTESNMSELWVSDRAEYQLCTKRPEGKWIGVRNVRFQDSSDEYAKLIGWYETSLGGVNQVHSSLGEAMRSYDKYIFEIRGRDNISASDLNFPEEYQMA